MKPVGRPTKYDETVLSAARSYVQNCQINSEMPFIEELALKLGIHDDTIVEWSKNNEEFSATVKKLKMLQKLHLKRGALEKKLHPSLAVFLLKANHGMNEDEKAPVEPLTVQVRWATPNPKTLEEAAYAKEEAIAALEKAEEAIAKFSGAQQEMPNT